MSGEVVAMRDMIQTMIERDVTAFPARIDSYDADNLRADVEMLQTDEEDNAPVVVDAPVVTIRAGGLVVVPPYSKGDEVLCVVSTPDLESTLYDGEPRAPEKVNSNELDYALVVGGTVSQTDDISGVSGSEGNLRIGDEDGNGVVEVTPGGVVQALVSEFIVDSDTVELGSGTLDALVKAGFLTNKYDTHVHSSPAGGTTGTPGTPSDSTDTTQNTEAS